MVVMASGIARGRVRTTTTTTTTELRNMAAIPPICSWRMPSFLGGIFKEKILLIAKADLIFLRQSFTEARI